MNTKKEELSSRDMLSKTPEGEMWLAMFDICLVLNFSELARTYFKKKVSWFNQRLHGYTVNGKPAKFKPEELSVLSSALREIASKILVAADKIDELNK